MEKGCYCCELCSKVAARMYCDSDEARLCWDCDEKVHSANFLVAKHSRCLLCHVCQSPTPWKASGTKLGQIISVCQSCFVSPNGENRATRMRLQGTRRREHAEQMEETEDETESLDDQYSESGNDDEYSDSDDEINEEEDDEDDGENQVVPWSYNCPTSSSSAPHLTTSCSSEHGCFSTRDGGAAVSSGLKRYRADPDDEDVCCSPQVNSKSIKMARAEEELVHQPESEIELRERRRRMEVLGSFMSFQQTTPGNRQHNASEVIPMISI